MIREPNLWMRATTEATVPIDIAVRQMSMTSFEFRPASTIEILGIATSTCLLAVFLCVMFCTKIGLSWFSSPLGPDAGGASNTMTLDKGSKMARSIRKWSTVSLGRLRTGHDNLQDYPQTSYFSSLGGKTRLKFSRKPLPMVDSPTTSIERNNAIFDLEEGLGLKSTPYSAVPNGYKDSPQPSEAVACGSLKPKEKPGSGGSFLHFRSASLR